MSVPTECFLVLVLVFVLILILILILILCVRHVQWFCGAPVVRALRPTYCVPLTVLPSTSSRNLGSLDTTAAVRWCDILSSASSTSLHPASHCLFV